MSLDSWEDLTGVLFSCKLLSSFSMHGVGAR